MYHCCVYLLESSRFPTGLDEIAIGIVVGRSGEDLCLSKPHGNVFMHEEDGEGQKPLSFLKEIISIYSSPGDWILTGPTGIGMFLSSYINKGYSSIQGFF